MCSLSEAPPPQKIGVQVCDLEKNIQNLLNFNPSNAEATFIKSAGCKYFLKTSKTLSCWYSLYSSH